MDKNKKLAEELLKADSIDPVNIPDSERTMFRQMLDKHLNSGQKTVLWRIIMKSKISKMAAAAVIIIAVFIGINFLGGSSVALADVAKKLEQVTNGVFKKTTTTYSLKNNNTDEFDSLTYYTDGAMLENMYRDNKLIYQVYVTFLEGILVNIDHQKKEYDKIELSDEDIQEFSQLSPGNIVNLILSKGEYKTLGRKTVDGILSDGFEFNDKRIMLSFDKNNIEDVTIHLWVDVKTDLPVRFEISGIVQNTLKANVIMYEPQWNVELEEDFFEPKIPEGYILHEARGYSE